MRKYLFLFTFLLLSAKSFAQDKDFNYKFYGQMLIGIAGRGWYQEEGKAAVEILPGTVIHIPANVKHWHGAAANSWFAHLAFELSGENTSNEWLEPVTDEEYDKIQMLP